MSTDVHTLSGAYALDALDPREARDFEQHLAECAVCRAEVAELQEAASLMGAAEAAPPSSALRDRLLEAVDRTPQVPPLSAPPAAVGADAPATAVSLDAARRARRPRVRLFAAAAAVAVAAVGGIVVTDAMRTDQPTLASGVTQVFRAADAQEATVATANGGRVSVAMSAGEGRMAVDTSRLPALGSRQVYQLWTLTDAGPVSAAVLEDAATGAAMDLPAAGTRIAITIEPVGGSEQPTTQPIVVVDPADV